MMELLSNSVFMQPWILASLAALPLLWYILRITPPVPKLMQFPATRFLIDLTTEENTPSHTPWWILLLRLFIAALIIIALARPVYNPADEITGKGPLRLVIDNSWAAAQTVDLQQNAAEEILAQASREKREVYILTTAAQPGENKPQQTGPMIAQDARSIIKGLKIHPWPANYKAATKLIKENKIGKSITSIWLSHGLDEGRLGGLVQTLQAQGTLSFIGPQPARLPTLLRPADHISSNQKGNHNNVQVSIDAPHTLPANRPIIVHALGQKSDILDVQTINLSSDKRPQIISFDIPDTLHNEISSFRLSGKAGAGGVFLLDEKFHKKDVGIAAAPEQAETAPLIEASYYLKRALEPYARLTADQLDILIEKNPSVIILPDIGAMPMQTLNALEEWVKKGGVLLRFSGPNMSQAQGEQHLIPVRLRAGGRSLSGSLSWDEPQKIEPFAETSPFFGLPIPDNITVRQQVLADPAQDLEGKIWAQLEDGTPLITAAPLGRGHLVLVHTTADPLWSDLALSGLYLDILKKIVRLSGRTSVQLNTNYKHLDPVLVMDGTGTLVAPPPSVHPLAVKELEESIPNSRHPPGIYSKGGFQYALNLGTNLPPLKSVGKMPSGVAYSHYEAAYERSLMPYLLAAALILFFLDWIIMMVLTSGVLSFTRPTRTDSMKALMLSLLSLLCFTTPAQAQETTAKQQEEKYAQGFYLAYVRTGDVALDQTTRTGLETLSKTLKTRTSIEPDGVAEINPETDTLAFFPLLYWSIGPSQSSLSDKALSNIQHYLDHGGTIIFDTRDNAQSKNSYTASPNMKLLRRMISTLNIPPLAPIPDDHVLGKTFYLLKTYPGRYKSSTLWIEQQSASGRDGVSSVIIGGNDWAGAWAEGPPDPMTRFKAFPSKKNTRQEMALRFGVNLVMYTLTGNYKADQVHLPHILKRLDRKTR